MRLNEFATVRTGLVLSRKESKLQSESFFYNQLNLKSIEDSGAIILENTIPYYSSEKLTENYLTQVGDVIIKTSEPYTAVYIKEEYAGLVIPSHFVIIRTDKSIALPQFITWYLNKDQIKKSFHMSCSGTLKQIKPKTVAETEIKLPDLEKQKQVVKLYDLSRQEIQLLEKLIIQKETFYKELLNEII